jgi:hypothetical protein
VSCLACGLPPSRLPSVPQTHQATERVLYKVFQKIADMTRKGAIACLQSRKRVCVELEYGVLTTWSDLQVRQHVPPADVAKLQQLLLPPKDQKIDSATVLAVRTLLDLYNTVGPGQYRGPLSESDRADGAAIAAAAIRAATPEAASHSKVTTGEQALAGSADKGCVAQKEERPIARCKSGRVCCSNPACDEVQGRTKFDQCSQCRAVQYCSRRCQKAHWKGSHKQACTPASCSPASV